MRTTLILLAVVFLVLAVPLAIRVDSALGRRRHGRAILDGGRLIVAAAAASGLLALAWRVR